MPAWPWRRQTQTPASTRPLIETLPASLFPSIQETAIPANAARVAAKGAPIRTTLPTGDTAGDKAFHSAYISLAQGDRDRKIALYQAYMSEVWVSASIEAIASRLISGGWTLSPVDALHPHLKTKEWLQEFLDWCNPDEEFSQILHDCATDLLWAGECYLEVTWKHSRTLHRDVPYELYTVDPISMSYRLRPDNKGIQDYVQSTEAGPPLPLAREQIIRVFFPDPRNRLRALSPLEKLMNPVVLDIYLQLSEQKYFQQGNRGNLAITLQHTNEAAAARYTSWLAEHALGVKNAHKPLIVFAENGDVAVQEIGNRNDLDVPTRRKMCRDEILAGYHISPKMVSADEGSSLGNQSYGSVIDKAFVHTALDPLRERMMNVLNFRLGVQGFGQDDWVIDTVYSDLRDDKDIVAAASARILAGLSTVNQEREASGGVSTPGGEVPIITVGPQVVPVTALPTLGDAPVAPKAPEVEHGKTPAQVDDEGAGEGAA